MPLRLWFGVWILGGDDPLTMEVDMVAVILIVSASLFVLAIAYLG